VFLSSQSHHLTARSPPAERTSPPKKASTLHENFRILGPRRLFLGVSCPFLPGEGFFERDSDFSVHLVRLNRPSKLRFSATFPPQKPLKETLPAPSRLPLAHRFPTTALLRLPSFSFSPFVGFFSMHLELRRSSTTPFNLLKAFPPLSPDPACFFWEETFAGTIFPGQRCVRLETSVVFSPSARELPPPMFRLHDSSHIAAPDERTLCSDLPRPSSFTGFSPEASVADC